MRVGAQELADVDVPGLGVGVVPGKGEGVAGVLRLQDHVVASVGATDSGGVNTSLTGSLETVYADSNTLSDRIHFESIEGLEVKPVGYNKRKFEFSLFNF